MAGKFLTEYVEVALWPDGRNATLRKPVWFMDSKGRTHIARPGLITDGRSGQIGYYLIGNPFATPHLRAAIIHDFYCSLAKLMPPDRRRVLRDAADLQFRDETLPACGVGWSKRQAMYAAVRAHACYHRNDPVADWREDFIEPPHPEACWPGETA